MISATTWYAWRPFSADAASRRGTGDLVRAFEYWDTAFNYNDAVQVKAWRGSVESYAMRFWRVLGESIRRPSYNGTEAQSGT